MVPSSPLGTQGTYKELWGSQKEEIHSLSHTLCSQADSVVEPLPYCQNPLPHAHSWQAMTSALFPSVPPALKLSLGPGDLGKWMWFECEMYPSACSFQCLVSS